jgi:hypothetical protein
MVINTTAAQIVVTFRTSSGDTAARCSNTRVQGVHDDEEVSVQGGISRRKSWIWDWRVWRIPRRQRKESPTVMRNSRRSKAKLRRVTSEGESGMVPQGERRLGSGSHLYYILLPVKEDQRILGLGRRSDGDWACLWTSVTTL